MLRNINISSQHVLPIIRASSHSEKHVGLPVVRVVEFWMETALLVCLNSASVALVIAASASDTWSVEGEHLGMF